MGDGDQVVPLQADTGQTRRLHELRALVSGRLENAAIERLTEEQLEFIVHPIKAPCFLSACPGSGKTEVVGFKLAYEASAWILKRSGIAVVTFTRNAAAEIHRRASERSGMAGSLYPHFVGTIDSWLHGYVFQPFGCSAMGYKGDGTERTIRIIDPDSYSGFLKRFDTDHWQGRKNNPVRVVDFYVDSDGVPVRGGLAVPPGQLRDHLIQSKTQFANAGFATYDDALSWTFRILKDSPRLLEIFVRRFPYVIVDECQDLCPRQLQLLAFLVDHGVVCHLVGDLNQAIYEFRQVDPKLVTTFQRDRAFRALSLTHNFRSVQPIVDFARTLTAADSVKGVDGNAGTTHCVLWQYDSPDQKAKLPGHFRQMLVERKIAPGRAAIVARGHATVNRLRQQTAATGIAADAARALALWHCGSRTAHEMMEALTLIGRVLSRAGYSGAGTASSQFCPKGIESAQWRRTLAALLAAGKEAATFAEAGVRLTWSDWVRKQLKPLLKEFWTKLPSPSQQWTEVERRFKAPDDHADREVSTDRTTHDGSGIRITTIHDVKGETLDAILLVSSKDKRSPGGHFSHWLADASDEAARFAYVAATRPRRLFVLATPMLSQAEIADLQSRGLKVESLQ